MTKLAGKNKAKFRAQVQKQKEYSKEQYKKGLVKQIRTFNDPVLKEKTTPVEDITAFKDTLTQMTKVLAATDNGVGLAASQIGITKNAFVIRLDPNVNNFQYYLNSRILKFVGTAKKIYEGCLSYPGVFCEVERNDAIEVEYTDENNIKHNKIIKEKESYIFQHEYQHILGICLVGDYWKDKQNPQPSKEDKAREITGLRFNVVDEV